MYTILSIVVVASVVTLVGIIVDYKLVNHDFQNLPNKVKKS